MSISLPSPDHVDVSIIVPCRNERDYIEGFVASLKEQDAGGLSVEILVVDGMSDDGTRELLERLRGEVSNLRVLDNPARVTPAALNIAIRAARGEVVIRLDVHTEYDSSYVRECVAVLAETGAACVGGPWRAAGRSYTQKAIALAFASPFSSGGARSHDVAFEGEVDAVYLGCWRRETLEKIGLFDEELVRNQDDELSFRLRERGLRLWQSPRIRSTYYPRPSLKKLFAQYSQYGYWKVRVIQKRGRPAALRHVVPALFALFWIVSGFAVALFPPLAPLPLVVGSCYALLLAWATLRTSLEARSLRYALVLPFTFAAFHLGYGVGTLQGLVDFVLLQKGGARERFVGLTR